VQMALTPDSTPRRTIASFDRYENAQALVDRLSDEGFPVEHLAIVGSDVKYVERITGRLDALRAAGIGAVTGAVMGLLFGLLFAAFFAHDGTSWAAIVAYWVVVGAVFWSIVSVVSFLMMRGRRNFASVIGLQPQRFDVMADESVVEEATRRLAAVARESAPQTARTTQPFTPH
jgi:hypothetical protein